MSTVTTTTERFRSHALLELMGHRRLAGYVEEVEVAGVGFLRVQVPSLGARPGFTQLISPKSIYAITPLASAEDAARIAATCRAEPLQAWELPAAPARNDPREITAIAGTGSPSEWSEFSGPGPGEDDDDVDDEEDDDDEYDDDDADADDDLADDLEDLAEDLEDEDADEDAVQGAHFGNPWNHAAILKLLNAHDQAWLRDLMARRRFDREKLNPAHRALVTLVDLVAVDSQSIAAASARKYVTQKLGLELSETHYVTEIVLELRDAALQASDPAALPAGGVDNDDLRRVVELHAADPDPAGSLQADCRSFVLHGMVSPATRELVERMGRVAKDACFQAPEVVRHFIAQHLQLGYGPDHFTVDVTLYVREHLLQHFNARVAAYTSTLDF